MAIKGNNRVIVGPRTVALLEGEDDITTWSDEELERGHRYDKNGRFSGRPPKVIPYAIVLERNRRNCTAAQQELINAVYDAARRLAAVARGDEEPNKQRDHVCEVLLNRVLGMSPININMEAPKPYEQLFQAIRIERDLGEIGEGQDYDYDDEGEEPQGRKASRSEIRPPVIDVTPKKGSARHRDPDPPRRRRRSS